MFCRKNDEESYAMTISEAWRLLGERAENAAAKAAGAGFDPEGPAISIELLGRSMRIFTAENRIARDGPGEPTLAEKVLVLHHLSFSSGAALTGQKVAFREIPGCQFYNTTFSAHTCGALVEKFGNDGDGFRRASMALGGVIEKGSGLVMRFTTLPRIPVWLIYWPGDDEMPAGAQVLYDSSVSSHLPAEDIAVLGEYTVHRVLDAAGGAGCCSLYEN